MFDIISIGDSTQDIFLMLDEENAHLHRLRTEGPQLCLNFAAKLPVLAKHDCIGGNATNTAVAFARLGLHTAIYTHTGQDATGERIQKELHRNHVALDYLVEDADTESNYNTVINYNGERTILVYHLHRHYSLPKMQASHWLYLTSMGEGFESILLDLLAYVREHKVNLCFQPGTYQLRLGAKAVGRLLHHTKVLFMNREEAIFYLDEEDTKTDTESLLRGLVGLGVEIAVITDGSKGASAYDGHHFYHHDAEADVPRIDTTGAGDSFAAGFTAALIEKRDIPEALHWGQLEASSVIQSVGAQTGLLYQKQMQELLRQPVAL